MVIAHTFQNVHSKNVGLFQHKFGSSGQTQMLG